MILPRMNRQVSTLSRIAFIYLGVYLLSITPAFSQLKELANEFAKVEQPVESISGTTTKIVRTIAFISLIITGLAFLYIKENHTDLTKKAGSVLVGVALFFIVFEVALLVKNG